jgi:hypothetical protein
VNLIDRDELLRRMESERVTTVTGVRHILMDLPVPRCETCAELEADRKLLMKRLWTSEEKAVGLEWSISQWHAEEDDWVRDRAALEAEVLRVRTEWDKQQDVYEACLRSSREDREKAEAELAALRGQLVAADELDTALEWLDNGYVVRSTDKLERLDTAQRVYREMRSAREDGES